MQEIALHDLVVISTAEATTTLTTEGLDTPQTATNTVLKAHHALEKAAGRPLPARIHLVKRIPPGSGMGGASSDAATTLIALQALYQSELHGIDLAPIAAEIGADVPFFLTGGRAVARGRGERLQPLPIEPAWFAIAWPRVELSTAAVYRAWDEMDRDHENHENHEDHTNQLTRAARRADPRVAAFAQRLGAGWSLTGSGSAFFKRCATEQDATHATANINDPNPWTAVTCAVGPRT